MNYAQIQGAIIALAVASIALLIYGLRPALKSSIIERFGENSAAFRHFVGGLIVFSIVLAAMLFYEVDEVYSFCASLLSFLFYYVTLMAIHKKREQMKGSKFEEQMLDFLVLVASNLKSGLALQSSIDIAARSVGGVVEEEFNLMLTEYRLGKELSEAIANMNKRVKSENLYLFSVTVTVSVRTGGSIASVLERLIFTIRKRNEIADKIKVIVSQYNFESSMMCILPLVAYLMVLFINPEMMLPLLTTKVGWATIGFIIVWQYIGFKFMKKISAIKL